MRKGSVYCTCVKEPSVCFVPPVFLVVFGTSLNASQSVCKMASIEFLVFGWFYQAQVPLCCPVCQPTKGMFSLKSLRDDRNVSGKVLE
jgi:hypothetical protein